MNTFELPLYELTIDDALGMYAVALVKSPAMQAKWQAFGSQQEPIKFAVQDEEQRKVLAVLCRADFPIYRRDPDGFEYYVIFRKDTIEELLRRLFKNSFQNEVNVEHDDSVRLDGVYLEQMFIKNTEKGIAPKGFEEVEEGSAFAQYKVVDDDVWEAVKRGIFTGISLEGYFKANRVGGEMTIEDLLKQAE